jgi:hypothetical protein
MRSRDIWALKFTSHLVSGEYPGVVDFIVAPSSFGFFDVRILRVCGFLIRDEEVIGDYVKYTAKGMGLAMIFGILNSIAAVRMFSGSNCVRYLGGSWVVQMETIEMRTEETERSLHKIDEMVPENTSEKTRNEYFRMRGQLSRILDRFTLKSGESQSCPVAGSGRGFIHGFDPRRKVRV